ncbi:MAG TPA: ATP-binding protein [Candidatus Methylacidiphilales bacterium]|nr:ATP-binding protein [Candidatus Methylacidiphilales bacterium]
MEMGSNQFFDGFSVASRDSLLAGMVRETYPDKEYLFREGDPGDSICLVLEGEVEIIKTAEAREKIMRTIKAGEFLGEVAVLDGHGRSTDARAKGDVVIGKIPSASLLEVLDQEPVALTLRLFQSVLNHLRRTNDLFVHEVVRKEKLSLVGEMANGLMHDIRNPIASIRLSADLMSMTHTDGETVHCCDGIRRQCDRLVGMAAELLEFSRGETKLNLAATDTASFLEQFQLLNEDYIRKSGVEFKLEVVPAEITVDSMRLMRVMQNLVTNAVDALGGTPGACIEIIAWAENSTFYLRVSDNGPGIPNEIKDRLFEPFVTHGKKHGTGLGMAIVQNVVAAHGGTITFESTRGQGTSFLVAIPQVQTAALAP